METTDLISVLSLIFGAVISPLIIWGAKRLYDGLSLKGTYINIMEATATAPYPAMRYDDAFEGVNFGVVVRIINTTNKLQALEKISLKWRNVKSSYLPELKDLIDTKPRLKIYDNKDTSVDYFYKNISANKDTYLPVLIKPDGGIVYLELKCNLKLYKTNFLKKQMIYPDIEKEKAQEIINNMFRGKGIIKAKISGKVRNFPVVF